MIGFIEVRAHGDKGDTDAGTSRRARGFYRFVLTIEDGSLQGDAAERSEGAQAAGGQVIDKKIIVMGCREEETTERLEVRLTCEVFLILEQSPAARQMENATLIGETLDRRVFTALHHGEGGKQQTVIEVTLEEEAGAEVLSLGGNHEWRGVSDAGGANENGGDRVRRVALDEEAASADAQTDAVEGIAKIFVTRGDVQAVKLESIRGTENKVPVGETGGRTEGALREEGRDFAAGSTEQGTAASRKLKNLSAGRNAKKQDTEANTQHLIYRDAGGCADLLAAIFLLFTSVDGVRELHAD